MLVGVVNVHKIHARVFRELVGLFALGSNSMKYIDLFCGIGGFRLAAETVCREAGIAARCVFSSDIDQDAQKSYAANFGERPFGDITKIRECDVPDHDILF
jgi:DNA (cytosine-5)-methyltransferase 1